MIEQEPFRKYFAIIPRKIDGVWVWFKFYEYRWIPNGAMGYLWGIGKDEYRRLK